MELTNWINKKLSEVENNDKFKRYFKDSIIANILERDFLINNSMGIDLILTELQIIETIHLFSADEINGISCYEGQMPFNLNFTSSRTEVNAILGKPNRSGGGYNSIVGHIPLWDKYYFANYTLHFQYSDQSQSIDLVTIGSLETEPYLNSDLQ